MKPYYEGRGVTLYHGDALDVLRGLETASVDAVVTDPPYGIDNHSDWLKDGRARAKIANDNAPFVWWLRDAARALRDASPLLCFCRWDVAEAFRQAIGWSGLRVTSQVVWDRDRHGLGDLRATPGPQHDLIWLAVKGRYTLPGRRPVSVVRHQRVCWQALTHPNQKPIELMLDLLGSYTKNGATILDPFAGSGTTLVAAAQTGRKAIGIELDERFCELAAKRLESKSTAAA